MTDQRELDRVLVAFFVEGTGELADRVIDAALDQIDHTRQRRAVRMPWRISTMNSTMKLLTRVAAVAAIGVLAVGGALYLTRPGQPAIGGSGGGASPTAAPGASSSAGLVVPDRVNAAGKLVWCASVDYPPFESYAADGTTAEGLDVDIAAEIARRWGVTSEVRATSWDLLLSNLGAGKCDLVISGMTSTVGGRTEQADFVNYLRVWTAFLVAPGNPKGINTLEDLAGKSVAVAPGTLTTEPDLKAASDQLVAAGKPAITISVATRSDDLWVDQLAVGRVDALAGDSVDVAYHLARPPYAGTSEVGGPAINPQPIGIAIRKDDTGMKAAVAAAMEAMYADGTMKAIVEKWGVTDAVELLK